MTAKVPLKVHLRLRFQNLGKPRTAGLCGWAAGACDCGLLSCAFIERPSPLEKLSCKVRFFTQTHSRKYRQKVTATTLFQITFHRGFSTSPTNGPHLLSLPKVGTHSAFGERSHTAAYAAKQVAFWVGVVSLPSERSTRFGNPAWPDVGTANFAAFGSWPGVLPKNAESLRSSDALMRVAVPKASRPRWAA